MKSPRLAVVILGLLVGAMTALLAQNSRPAGVVSKADLIKLSEAGVQDELIITMIRGAEQVPHLTADDVITLQEAGVSMNVLTAVIQRRTALGGRNDSVSGLKSRRIRITATLRKQRRSFWKRGLRGSIDKAEVSWGFRALAWSDQAVLELPLVPNCPKDTFCATWSEETKECTETTKADSEAWRSRYGCYLADRVTQFDEQHDVFEVDLLQPVSHAEVRLLYRNVDGKAEPWFTEQAADSPGKRVPGFVKFTLWGADDIDLRAHIELFMSPKGYVQDFRIAECEVVNRDEAALQRRILSDQRQYCAIVEAQP